MNLYLLRHALAVPRGTTDYGDDSLRPLTEAGVEKMSRAAKGMHNLKLEFDLILSSPFLRARHTADIVATEFGAEAKQKLSDHLATDSSPEMLIGELNKTYRSRTNILLVGHEPHLSQLVSVLLTGNADLLLTLKKGGLCKLTIETLRYQRCATLEWLLTPRQLRRLR